MRHKPGFSSGKVRGEVELATGVGRPAAAAFTAEGDTFFKALDRLKNHLTEGIEFE